MNTAGLHVTADVWFKEMPTMARLQVLVSQALAASGMRVVGNTEYVFGPDAFTAVWLLAASHLSVHTFPEQNFVAFDCYTCGDEGDPIMAINNILSGLAIRTADINIHERGQYNG